MLTYNLYNKVLIEPAVNRQATRLQIVTGTATPQMAKEHINTLASLKLDRPIHIELIVGMPQQYIEKSQHQEFCELTESTGTNVSISCKYIATGKYVHAKTYCWSSENGEPVVAFAGSANYSMAAFGVAKNSDQTEAMAYVDAETAKRFHGRVRGDSIDCTDPKAITYISHKIDPKIKYKINPRRYARRYRKKHYARSYRRKRAIRELEWAIIMAIVGIAFYFFLPTLAQLLSSMAEVTFVRPMKM